MKYEVYYCPDEYYEENIIEVESKKEHSNYLYSQCPVWGHRFDRTFTGYSPIDFEINFSDLENKKIHFAEGDQEFETIDVIDCVDDGDTYLGEYFSFDLSDIMNENPVIQIKFVTSFIWTNFDREYLWFDFLDHPMTSYENNFFAIGGWFNVANHPRKTSLAIKVVDQSRSVKILKGDPLYRIRFYTEDLNDNPVLIKKKSPKGLNENMKERQQMLIGDNKFLKKILFEKDIRKQCPYHNQ